MQKGIKFTDAGHIAVFYYNSDLISYTRKDIQHKKGPTDWHIHINIYKYNLPCAHSNCLYYTE